MMADNWPAIDRIIPAEHLRRYASISKIKYDQQKQDLSHQAHILLEEQKRKFLEEEYLEREFEALEVKILDAAKHGNYDIEVLRFNAAFCSDGGRAINNSEKDWPATLQGKAKNFHEIWKRHGQPKGYRMMAKIVSFPKGFMGDVSLYVDWS